MYLDRYRLQVLIPYSSERRRNKRLEIQASRDGAVGSSSPESMAGMGSPSIPSSVILQSSREGAIQQQREKNSRPNHFSPPGHVQVLSNIIFGSPEASMIKGPAMIRPTPPLPNRQPMVMEPSSASPVRLFRVEATLTQAAGLRASLQPAPSRPRPRPQKGRSPIRPCFFIYDTTHTQRQRQSGRGRAEAVVNASSLVRGGNLSQQSSRPTTKCRTQAVLVR